MTFLQCKDFSSPGVGRYDMLNKWYNILKLKIEYLLMQFSDCSDLFKISGIQGYFSVFNS